MKNLKEWAIFAITTGVLAILTGRYPQALAIVAAVIAYGAFIEVQALKEELKKKKGG